MCGIAGIYNTNESAVNLNTLILMKNKIHHRGPDDGGIVLLNSHNKNVTIELDNNDKYKDDIKYSEVKCNIGLAHKRLSIIDLSKLGHQPMCNEDRSIWITYNGEIYNHQKIKEELQKYGHLFRSRTDTEVIIHAYEEWGIDAIHKFNGMFAFGLWDANKKIFYLVRDRLGIKPIYFTHIHNNLYFASEIKSLLEVPQFEKRLNKEILSQYFSFLAVPAPNTMFERIKKIPAGHYLKFREDNSIDFIQYWDCIPPKDEFVHDEIYYLDEVEAKLKKSISLRMMSDVPFGVFLSGGVDSSMNVALMSQMSNLPINTFTIGFEGLESNNEFNYARQIAKMYATNHNEIMINRNKSEQFIYDIIYHQDEPIADPVCIPLYFLAQKAKEHGVLTIQIGEGADEIFSGYDYFKIYKIINDSIWKYLKYCPKSFRKSISMIGKNCLNVTKYKKYIDYFDFLVDKKELFWGQPLEYYPSEVKILIGQNYTPNAYESVLQNIKNFEKKGSTNYLEKMAYLELKMRMPELLLMRVDKMTMASSIEGRVPFLDYELVQFVANIPDKIKMKNGTPKYVLKKIAEKYLPKDLVYRKKRGFGFPIKEWFDQGFDKFLIQSIYNSRIREEEIINYSFVREMFDQTQSGKVNYHGHLWCLANLCIWYDRWIDS